MSRIRALPQSYFMTYRTKDTEHTFCIGKLFAMTQRKKKNKDRQNEEESGSQVVIVVAAFKSFRLSVKFRHVHFQWDFLNLIYNISIFKNENSGTIEYF